jgi:hypothetical protein
MQNKELLFIVVVILKTIHFVESFNLMDYTHYLDYLPYRQEGLASFEVTKISIINEQHLYNLKS